MARNYKRTAGLALAGLFLWAGLAGAQEGQECNTQNLKGTYSWRAGGSIPGATIAAIGVFTLNGEGGLLGTETASFNGDIREVTWTGTYSVNRDCTVSARVSVEGFRTRLEFVFADNGKEFFGIQADPPGTVLTIVGKRQ